MLVPHILQHREASSTLINTQKGKINDGEREIVMIILSILYQN